MSTKYPSPLLGYNNNVRHKGKVFHIQTEDSGVKYGHIITHLFMDGGRILKSVKTSYAEYIGNDRMAEIVREMMKQQHKAMFIALRDGKFDAIIESGSEASHASPALAPESTRGADFSPIAAAGPPQALPVPGDAAVTVTSHRPAPVLQAPGASGRRPPPPAVPSDGPDGPPTEVTRQMPPELTFDIEALERAAAAASSAPPGVLRATSDLPPPPPSLFREKSSGKYKVAPPATSRPPPIPRVDPIDSETRAEPASRTGRPSDPAAGSAGERRYAPTRPAAIFGQARLQQGKSIFGEDLISDKSLDEVILSYLAEDLDGEKK